MPRYNTGGFGGKIDWGQAEVETNPNGSEEGFAGWDSSGDPTVRTAPPSDAAPVGCVMAWLKSYTNTPSLPSGWVECDGSVLNDAASVYDGQTLPDLNGDNRFLRGNSTSGGTGGSETHTHVQTDAGNFILGGSGCSGADGGAKSGGTTDATSTLPTYYEVVWIMRVK